MATEGGFALVDPATLETIHAESRWLSGAAVVGSYIITADRGRRENDNNPELRTTRVEVMDPAAPKTFNHQLRKIKTIYTLPLWGAWLEAEENSVTVSNGVRAFSFQM